MTTWAPPERPTEAAWISAVIERNGGVAPALLVEEVLELHAAYLDKAHPPVPSESAVWAYRAVATGPVAPGSLAPGHLPPGYVSPGYPPPGYPPSGFAPPGYVSPGPPPPGVVSPEPPPPTLPTRR